MKGDLKKINSILTFIFYVLAIAAVVAYFMTENKGVNHLWMYLGFSAIGTRLISYILKYLM